MSTGNAAQQDFWTGTVGEGWVRDQVAIDRVFRPVLEALLEAADLPPGARVLDIGCGSGASSLAAARSVGPSGFVLGADISETLLAQARTLAGDGPLNVEFWLADAQTASFEPAFEALISRFGMMFFADPRAAFENLAAALVRDARMTFICWGALAENPWFRLSAEVAAEIYGPDTPGDPHSPGPMAFADPGRVTGLMATAGLRNVAAETVEIMLTLAATVDDAAALATRIGPAVRRWRAAGADPDQLPVLAAALRDRLAPFACPEGVRVPARLILYRAVV